MAMFHLSSSGPPNSKPEEPGPTSIVRGVCAVMTVGFAVGGFIVDEGSAKFFAVSSAFGIAWWGWDLLVDHVFVPMEYWIGDLLSGGTMPYKRSARTVEQRLAMLEQRMETGKTPRMQIQAALRLADLYELQKKDQQKAREVIERISARYPHAPELQHRR